MPDVRRIVTLPGPVVLQDLETVGIQHAQDSWTVTPGERRPILSADQRRYGGAITAQELHDNGAIGWSAMVSGATVDQALTRMEDLLGVLEQPRTDLFYEWRPEGASVSSFYQVRGPASYKPQYQNRVMAGAQMWQVDVTIPVGPLALGAPSTQTFSAASGNIGPYYAALSSAIPGRATSLAQITLNTSTAYFGMVAWAVRPTATDFLPAFGVIESDDIQIFQSNTTVVSNSSARGGTMVTAGSGGGAVTITVDASTMRPDPFRSTVDIEVWGRFSLGSTAKNVTTSINRVAYAASVPPVTGGGTGFRVSRLGVFTMASDPVGRNDMRIAMDQDLSLDYVVLVPARQRAITATAKAEADLDFFVRPTTNKTIRTDLSAYSIPRDPVTLAKLGIRPTAGMGGSRLELPPGDIDLLVWLERLVPNDPVPVSSAGTSNPTLSLITLQTTPRYWLTAS